jgi:hypothetical protein
MNKNEPSLTPEVLEQPIPNRAISRMRKVILAFFLGVIFALNFALLCGVIIGFAVEAKGAGLGMLLVTTVTLACSYAGAALAARTARQ